MPTPMHTPPSEAKLDPMGMEPLEAQLEALLSWARSDAATPTTPEGWTAALCLVAGLPEARRAQGFLVPGYAALATPLATPLPPPCHPPLPPPCHTPVPRLSTVPPGTHHSLVGYGRCPAPSPNY